jgi:hypothetical protein
MKINEQNADDIKKLVYTSFEKFIKSDDEIADFMDEPEFIEILGKSISETVDSSLGLDIDINSFMNAAQFDEKIKTKKLEKKAATKKMPWKDRLDLFKKKAKAWTAGVGTGVGGEWVRGLFTKTYEKIVKNLPNILSQLTDPTFLRETGSFFANKEIMESAIPEMYSPSAYDKLLNDKGYGGELLSQGAYDIPSGKLNSQFKNFYPDLASSSKYKDPDIQKELKSKFAKVGNKSKFIKVSQTENQQSSESMKAQIDQLRKNIPNWQVPDILAQIKIIADNPNMSFQDKQRSVANIVNEYATSLKTLEEIIKKNVNLPELQ